MDIYFIFWDVIQHYFILLLKLFQIWPLGALQLTPVPLTYYIIVGILFWIFGVLLYFPVLKDAPDSYISCLNPSFSHFIHSNGLCLLIRIFRPLIFKVIIDIVGLTSTVFINVFDLLHLLFLSPCPLLLPSLILIKHFTWFSIISSLSISHTSLSF